MKLNDEEQEEYDSMTDEAKECYEILERQFPEFKHSDIMDTIIGFSKMKVYNE